MIIVPLKPTSDETSNFSWIGAMLFQIFIPSGPAFIFIGRIYIGLLLILLSNPMSLIILYITDNLVSALCELWFKIICLTDLIITVIIAANKLPDVNDSS